METSGVFVHGIFEKKKQTLNQRQVSTDKNSSDYNIRKYGPLSHYSDVITNYLL